MQQKHLFDKTSSLAVKYTLLIKNKNKNEFTSTLNRCKTFKINNEVIYKINNNNYVQFMIFTNKRYKMMRNALFTLILYELQHL